MLVTTAGVISHDELGAKRLLSYYIRLRVNYLTEAPVRAVVWGGH